MSASLVGSEMCIRDRPSRLRIAWQCQPHHATSSTRASGELPTSMPPCALPRRPAAAPDPGRVAVLHASGQQAFEARHAPG
eukprot:9182639-Alexandrium_andersonii.AAC.1